MEDIYTAETQMNIQSPELLDNIKWRQHHQYKRDRKYANETILRLHRYATHPILIHRAVLEKLRFEKKVKKFLTSNISEIYEPIILPKEHDRDL